MRRKALWGMELWEDAVFMHFMAYLHLHNDCRKLSASASFASYYTVMACVDSGPPAKPEGGPGSAPPRPSIDVTTSLYFRQITPHLFRPTSFTCHRTLCRRVCRVDRIVGDSRYVLIVRAIVERPTRSGVGGMESHSGEWWVGVVRRACCRTDGLRCAGFLWA